MAQIVPLQGRTGVYHADSCLCPGSTMNGMTKWQ